MTESFRALTLPSDYEEMELFIKNNKVKLTEQIVLSVQYALSNGFSSVEVFNFEDSDFIVILDQSTFKDNIDNIFDFYVSTEQYEFCDRLVKLKQQLEQHEQKQQEIRYKSKGTSKHKN
jgi:alpha-glucosidase (family GH31 glycosyl hydrolase)